MYLISPQERLVSVSFSGYLSVGDVHEYVDALRGDPSFKSDFNEIVDLTAVAELELDPDQALKLADIVDPFAPGVKRAFVARTRFQHHAARLHQILRSDEGNIRIFPSLDEAKKWVLGSP